MQVFNPGRRQADDPRDRNFLASAVLRRLEPRKTKRYAFFFDPLDQGREGTCVGHGWKHCLLATPIKQTQPYKSPTAVEIYDLATTLDEWYGNEGNREFGTSVRAGAKALQQLGYITEYRWAFDCDTAIDWIINKGPIVIGVNWYSSMFDTSKDGFIVIEPNAYLAGGHCVLLHGWDEKRGCFEGINSWGRNFGYLSRRRKLHTREQTGRFRLSGETADRLFRVEDGEICMPTEYRHTTVKG
jgi:hypothetical protein